MKYLPLLAAVLLAGCGTVQQVRAPIPSTFSYGPAPSEIEQQIKERMEQTLIDPTSAIYDIEEPVRAACHTYGNMQGDMKFKSAFWAVPFEVNAKNRLGGYAGRTQYYAKFANGRLTEVVESLGNCTRVDENGVMKDATREPLI